MQYGQPQQNYGMAQAQPTGMQGAFANQQQQSNPYGAPQQQASNPYSAPPQQSEPVVNNEENEELEKEIYQVEQKAQEWKFIPEFDQGTDLQMRTACCCCNAAFDDCEDWMRVQQWNTLLCIQAALSLQICQCEDMSVRACLKTTQKIAYCDMTQENDEGDAIFTLCFGGAQGVLCMCCKCQQFCSTCDPCQMPETCCKSMVQCFFCHIRSALPCDDDVPFEIGCCGIMCLEAEEPEEENNNNAV